MRPAVVAALALSACSAQAAPVGSWDASVTPAQLCERPHSAWIAAERAKDTYELRDRVYRVYGLARGQRAGYVVDHIVPLEIGGRSVEENLRPQERGEAAVKDRDEHRLHRAVCAGTMTLPAARAEIERLWGRAG